MAERALATAFVNIVPGTKDFETLLKAQLSGKADAAGVIAGNNLGSSMGKSFASKIKGALGPALATIGTTFALYKGVDFLKDSVRSASDFNEQGAAVGQVFGKAAGDIQKFAESGAGALGQSKTQVLEAAKSFGIYGKAAGYTGQKNAEFSKTMVQLATDLASFNNTSVDDAIQALGAGLRGENEPLRRYGVLLDDASLKAAYFAATGKKVTGTLTPQQKVLAAQASIMKQTATQQGDFARTSDGLANSQRILQASMENLKITAGTALTPAFAALAQALIPVAEQLGPVLGETFAKLTPVFTSLAGVLPKLLTSLMPLFPVLADLVGIVGEIAVALMPTFVEVVQALMPVVKALVPPLLAVVRALLPLLPVFAQLVVAITPIITALLPPLAQLIKALVPIITLLVGVISAIAVPIFKVLASVIAVVIGWVAQAVTWFLKMGTKIASGIATAGKAVGEWFAGLPKLIGDFFSNAGTWLVQAGKNVLDGLVKGFKDGVGAVGKAIGDVAGSVISNFKRILGIASPSKVFKEFGKNILQGLSKGLQSGEADKISAQMEKVSKFITNALADKKISKAIASSARGVVKKYSGALQGLASQREAVIEELKTATDELKSKIDERLNYVSNIAQKFGSSLTILRKSVDQLQIMDAQDSVVAAQKELTDATSEFGASSREATRAALKLAKAQQELDGLQNGTTAAGVMSQLRDRIAANKQLTALMAKLQSMGISGELYQQILESGSLELAQSIIDGGSAAITELNALAAEANATALKLAQDAGDILFNKGIEVAQGVVDGLKAKEADILAQIKKWSDAFVSAISAAIQGLEIPAAPDAGSGSGSKAPATKKPATKTPAKTPAKAPATKTVAKAVTSAATAAARAAVGKGIPKFAAGGFVSKPTVGLIGEAGPEVVTPLKDFERMMGSTSSAQTVNYYAAPNQSLDAEQALFQAIKRAKVIASW